MKRRTPKSSTSNDAPAAPASTAKRARPARTRQQLADKQKADPIPSKTSAVHQATPSDGLTRCKWAGTYKGAAAAAYVRYHDEEWGRPCHDDKQLFELLVLEGAQAGLSWSTILAKRDAYRAAFKGFDPQLVAAYGDEQLAQMLAEGSGVVRHKGKLASAVQNAKAFLRLQQEHGSFDHFVWGFVPNRQPIVNSWSSMDQVPTKTSEAEALSKALKQAGMNFVGPTTMYAFMQASGLVNDHTTDCHCYQPIIDSYSSGGKCSSK